MINARQRVLLGALGIPVWIPKASSTSTVKHGPQAEHRIWRSSGDEQVELSATVPQLSQVLEPVIDQVVQQQHSSNPVTTALLEANPVIDALRAEVTPSALPHIKPEPDISHTVMTEKPLSSIPFRIQACEINQWILLVNEDDLKNHQFAQLWQNILQAFQKNTADQVLVQQFAWPLAEGLRWQSATGAKSALSGFLFRMGLDKRVGLMSELPDEVCPDRIERLPHLAELIAEPLKKRMLWNLLR